MTVFQIPIHCEYEATWRGPLAVQWLGLRAFTAGAQVRSLVRELRSCTLSCTGKNYESHVFLEWEEVGPS